MSQYIFQQDGAPAHTAKRAQEWCNTNLIEFWHKSQWPGNSPDLNPIENLWSIVKQEIELMDTPTSIAILVKHLKQAWSQISPESGEFSIRESKKDEIMYKTKGWIYQKITTILYCSIFTL